MERNRTNHPKYRFILGEGYYKGLVLVLSNDQIDNIGPESIENRTPSATLTMLLGPYEMIDYLIIGES